MRIRRSQNPDILGIKRTHQPPPTIKIVESVHPHIHPRQRRLQLPASRPGYRLDILTEPRHVLELVEDVRLHLAYLAVGHLVRRDTSRLRSRFPGSLETRPEGVGYDLDEAGHIQLARPQAVDWLADHRAVSVYRRARHDYTLSIDGGHGFGNLGDLIPSPK